MVRPPRLFAIAVAVAAPLLLGGATDARRLTSPAAAQPDRPWVLVDGRGGPAALAVDPPGPRCERSCAMVIVDGFNNTLADATRNFDGITATYRDAGGACDVFGFSWRSDVGLGHFRRAEEVADGDAARALAAWLRTERAECRSRPVHLVGHSLAARVLLRALVPATGAPREARLTVESAALIAPAIPADALEPGGELGAAVPQIGRLGVYYNSEDYMVLGLFYPLAARRSVRPLGLQGSRERARLPPHVVEVDFGDRWGPTHTALRAYDRTFWDDHLRRLTL